MLADLNANTGMGYLGTAPPPPTPLPTTKSPSATTAEGVRAWTRSLRPPRDHAETSLTVGRARPERNSQVRTSMRSRVWAYHHDGATERRFRALRRSALLVVLLVVGGSITTLLVPLRY